MFAVIFMTMSATARFARAACCAGTCCAARVITLFTSALGAVIAVKLPETGGQAGGGDLDGRAGARSSPSTDPRAAAPPTRRRRLAGSSVSDAARHLRRLLLGRLHHLDDRALHRLLRPDHDGVGAVTKPVNLISCVAASVVFFIGGSSTCASACRWRRQPGRRLAGRPRRAEGRAIDSCGAVPAHRRCAGHQAGRLGRASCAPVN